MVQYVGSELAAEAAYKLLIGCIVPRPIAWISTLSAEGRSNLAPFSAFTFVSSKPPMVAVNIGRRGAGLKDTARNIHETKEFVVNIADFPLVEALHRSSFEYPAEVSEIEELNLATLPSRDVRPPRLAAAPVNLECRLHSVCEFGDYGDQLIVGEVIRFHVRDALCENGKIDSAKLNPIARLGGPNYARLGEKLSFGPAGVLPEIPAGRPEGEHSVRPARKAPAGS